MAWKTSFLFLHVMPFAHAAVTFCEHTENTGHTVHSASTHTQESR